MSSVTSEGVYTVSLIYDQRTSNGKGILSGFTGDELSARKEAQGRCDNIYECFRRTILREVAAIERQM